MEILGGGSLQISNLTEEDAGVYTCMADNSNATIEAQAQLTVQGTLINTHALLLLHCRTSGTNKALLCTPLTGAVNHDNSER